LLKIATEGEKSPLNFLRVGVNNAEPLPLPLLVTGVYVGVNATVGVSLVLNPEPGREYGQMNQL